MKKKENIECLNCGKLFHPERKTSKFCCRDCSTKYNKEHGIMKKSEEQKAKISASRKGTPAWNKGRKMSTEEKEKMIMAVKNAWTDEKKEKQSQIQKKAWSNPELLQKHSEIMKKMMTKENREHISVATKNAMKNPDILEKIRQSCRDKYGVDWNCLRPEANNHITISKKNRYWQNLLNVPEEDLEFAIDGFSFDLKIGQTLIEINPTETHNSTYSIFGKDPKDPTYHIKKTCVANKHGFECFHIWDWDEEEKIKKMLSPKTGIGGRLCQIKEIDDINIVNNFLNTYHIQNTCRGIKKSIGLFYNNELIGLMVFGLPRYNKNIEWELLRLCYCDKYTVMGGTKKMFDYFIKTYNPKSIISYCDKSKFSGKTYIDLEFKAISYQKPSRHWYNMKTKRHITDNLLRQRGFSQLHNDNQYTEHQKGENNDELMLENGYVVVYDCGQATYVWKNPNNV